MQFISIYIHQDNSYKRVDALCKTMTSLAYNTIMNCIRKKCIRINKKACKTGDIMYTGDTIDFIYSLQNSLHKNIIQQKKSMENNFSIHPYHQIKKELHVHNIKKYLHSTILYHNNDFICINKKKGQAVFGKDSIAQKLKKLYFQAFNHHHSSLVGFKAAPCHRLDRNTSGILVCAWNVNAAREIQLLQSNKYISKLYFGIVTVPKIMHEKIETSYHLHNQKSVTYQHTLYRKNNITIAVPLTHQNIYPHHSDIKFLGRTSLKTSFLFPLILPSLKHAHQHIWCVALQPLGTGGKTHQIRAQCKQMQIPLWGDIKYSNIKNKTLSSIKKIISPTQGYFLHAALLFNKNTQENTKDNHSSKALLSKKLSHFSLPSILHAPLPLSWMEIFRAQENTSNFFVIEKTIKKIIEEPYSLTNKPYLSSNTTFFDIETEEAKIDLIDCFNSIFGRVRG